MRAIFTANDARGWPDDNFDQKLRNIVAEAKGETSAIYKVYRKDVRGNFESKCNLIADELIARGFKFDKIRWMGAFRFAEVHFSWD